MNPIRLHLNGSYWRNPRPGVYIAGTVFEGSTLLDDDGLVRQLAEATAPDKLVAKVTNWLGFFAVVIEGPFGVFLAVDRIRSIPLFYGATGFDLHVSDEAGWVRRHVGDTQRDPLAAKEFLLTGYVTGTETLFANVRQLQAGEALITRRLGDRILPKRVRYARFVRLPKQRSEAELLEELEAATEASIDRLVTFADGRPIVIPLSGGLDSRLIATTLASRGYPDLRCFTYGQVGNAEAAASRVVAMQLGLEWAFVPYSTESWRQWGTMPAFRNYLARAHQHTSVSHIQDWPAVMKMTEDGAIPRGSVFVPGHTGDFTAGGHTLPAFVNVSNASASDLANAILDRHYRLWSLPEGSSVRSDLISRILDRLGLTTKSRMSGEEVIAAHDTWNWQERQAKFIVNSVRVYESMGHHWWIPLWDTHLMAFWESVPLEWRVGMRLHRSHVAQRFAGRTPMATAHQANRGILWGIQRNSILHKARRITRAPVLRSLTEALARSLRRQTAYHTHPLAWFGLLERGDFRRRYSGKENINSFLGDQLIRLPLEELELESW